MVNDEILILGAGPSGLAAAFELNKGNKRFIVVEKDDIVGGLGKTLSFGEFITDIGPHRFFSKNKYLYDFIEDLLGEHWIKVNRYTRFYIDNKFYNYPVDIINALTNVGPYRAVKILSDYCVERVKDLFIKREKLSFEDSVVADFGRSLAELNMLNYTEKIWGIPCTEISSEWATQRIKGLSLVEVAKNAIFKSNNGPKTLVDQFYYPDLGTGMIYESIKKKLPTDSVLLKSYPLEVHHDDKKITEVLLNIDGKLVTSKPEYVLSSIPLTKLLDIMRPAVPRDISDAAKHLKFRSHVSLLVTVNKPTVFPDQWIYFPNKEIPFGRIMEPRNFSDKLSPKGKTSLLIEFFCWENDRIWNANAKELYDMSIVWLEKIGFLTHKDVIGYFIVSKEKYAYPVYDITYKKYLQPIKDYLNTFDNLLCIGRAGSFRYNNQDHALEMGILAARSIIEGKRYDLDSVGAEQEYFEKGYVK